MEVVERLQERQQENAALLEKAHRGRITPAEWQRVIESNRILGEDLTTLMTAMSFQDLTGQRIKKAVSARRPCDGIIAFRSCSAFPWPRGRCCAFCRRAVAGQEPGAESVIFHGGMGADKMLARSRFSGHKYPLRRSCLKRPDV